MLRFASILAMASILGGCAAQSAPPQQARVVTPTAAQQDAPALALVLDPPVIRGLPPIDLARAERRVGAFGGYQNLTATYFSIQTIDQQASDWSNNYQRRTEMNQVGVNYR
jgi:hypothetical protein